MGKTLSYTLFILIIGLFLVTENIYSMNSEKKTDIRISARQLKEMLGDDNLIIIDVRDPISWGKSDSKIVGALREDPRSIRSWISKYPKEKTIVFYCS